MSAGASRRGGAPMQSERPPSVPPHVHPQSEASETKRPSKARTALRSFYGIGGGGEEEKKTVVAKSVDTVQPDHPEDIDVATFEAHGYVDKLLRESNFRELVDHHVQLKSEILQLDNDMQTLVYENYNKFISATDTIRQMKSHVGEMEMEMKLLEGNVDSISSASESLSDRLKPRRAKIDEVAGVHKLVRRLQFVFELPTRLRKSVEMRAFVPAVKYYKIAAPILARQSALKAFETILVDCLEAVEDMKRAISEVLEDPKSPPDEADQAISLLLDLEVPQSVVYNRFMIRHHAILMRSIETANSEINELESITAMDAIELYGRHFLPPFREFLESRSRYALFRPRDHGSHVPPASSDAAVPVEEDLLRIYTGSLVRITGSPISMNQLIDCLAFVRQHLESLLGRETAYIAQVFEFVQESMGARLNHLCEEAGTACDAAIVHMESLRSSVASSSQQQVHPQLTTKSASAAVMRLSAVLGELIVKVLPAFKNAERLFGAGGKEDLYDSAEVKIQGVLLRVVKALTDRAADKNPEHRTGLLLLSKTAADLQQSLSSKVFRPLYNAMDGNPMQHCRAEFHVDAFGELSRTLLRQYVILEGRAISKMIRTGIPLDCSGCEYPRGVRAVYVLAYKYISGANTDVSCVFSDRHGSDSSSHGSSSHRVMVPSAPTQRRTVESNVARLFEKRIDFFTDVEPNRQSIVFGIVKIALKTLIETVRLCSFNKEGYQQMQVDVHFLRVALRVIVDDDRSMDALLTEVLHSTADRSYDAESFQPSVIEHLCSKSFASLEITYNDFAVL